MSREPDVMARYQVRNLGSDQRIFTVTLVVLAMSLVAAIAR